MMNRITQLTKKHPRLGPILWILAVQYLIVQLIVAAAWMTPYDWANNFISDLGNTVCGPYGGLYVCSPLHPLMNASFILFGITMASGALLLFTRSKRSRLSLIGFMLMVIAGLGTILVGLFPENTIGQLHTTGAFLGLGVGNVSIMLLAVALKEQRAEFRLYGLFSGAISLVAFVLFVVGLDLGLGTGGIERLVSYPFAIWMILFGICALHDGKRQP